ncbi:MAG: FAD-dependent oxidoreductase [Marmoricola sp.]
MIDAADQVLPPFGEKLGRTTEADLRKLGIEVELGTLVTDVDETGLEVQDRAGERRRIEAVTKIWACRCRGLPTGPPTGRAKWRDPGSGPGASA